MNLDSVITRLLNARNYRADEFVLSENIIYELCDKASQIFNGEPMLVEVNPPIQIYGDLHGQYQDLLRHMDICGYPPTVNCMFLGDYVDRGSRGLEVVCLLLAYKIKYPQQIVMLRGNHECPTMNKDDGFREECQKRSTNFTWSVLNCCFNTMPVAAIVGESIFCSHGGISPFLRELQQIRRLHRPSLVPDLGLYCDLLWSDPDEENEGWQTSPRGLSFTYGRDVVDQFLNRFGFSLIARAHQVVDDGFRLQFDNKVVTVFSAPSKKEKNDGAVMLVSDDLKCTFKILKPA